MIQLSRSDVPVSRQELALLEGLTEPYIYKIFRQLKAAGFVDARLGRTGGYFLARPPQSISVADLYEALEGPLHLIPCEQQECQRRSDCSTTDFWSSVSAALHDAMAARTIADLAADTQKLRESSPQFTNRN